MTERHEPLSAIPDDFEWIREDPERWQCGANGLTLATDCGTLWNQQYTARNLLVAPTAAAITRVTVHLQPTHGGEQLGLMRYESDDDWIKLIKERFDNRDCIVLAWSLRGKCQFIAAHDYPDAEVELQLAPGFGGLLASFRPLAAPSWRKFAAVACPSSALAWRPGILAHGSQAGNSGTVRDLILADQT